VIVPLHCRVKNSDYPDAAGNLTVHNPMAVRLSATLEFSHVRFDAWKLLGVTAYLGRRRNLENFILKEFDVQISLPRTPHSRCRVVNARNIKCSGIGKLNYAAT
jgi:hypothetical protein